MRPDLVVRPADPLDLAEARRLAAELDALPAGVRVQVDLAAVREVHPAALASLALRLDGRTTLGGLSRRQERLLAYVLGDAQGCRRASAAASTSTPAATSGVTA